MADRSIVVRLRAEVQGFKSEMAAAAKAAESVGKGTEDAGKKADTAMGRMVQSATQNKAAWTTAGATLTGFGAAALGALGLAAKAAMDWESAWAGVVKTVDGSPEQMAALEAGLRGLARELPASHQEIAAVAEAAGQLGIKTENILGFTRTMINMGEATNLSAEEAATSLSRFMNVMGTSQSDVGKLGASIVGLGNNFATTESEIVQMAQRLSGAGAQANLTEGDVLGIATAMSSVGIEAEAGGSAMSLTMKRIGKAVDEGGDKLETFAKVSGMSADEFSAKWKSDPAAALDAFVTGLSSVESQGMTTNGVLSDLGITGIRESDALLRLSAAAGQGADGMSLLGEAVQMGNSEFDKGTALIAEASKRYETAESRIQLAKNALVDMGISIGGAVLPAIADLADKGADMAGWFADLPEPVQKGAAALTGVAGAGSLVAGGFLLLVPRVIETVNAFKTLGPGATAAAKAMGKVALAATALTVLESIGDSMADFSMGANEAADKANRLKNASDPLAVAFEGMGMDADLAKQSTDDLAGGLDVLANGSWWGGIQDFSTNLGNVFGANNATLKEQKQRLEELGVSLAGMAQVDLPGAQKAFTNLWDAMGGSAEAGANLLKVMPQFRDELVGIATAAGLATDDQTLLKIATGEIKPALDGAGNAAGEYADGMDEAATATDKAADAASEALESITDLANEFLAGRDAARQYAEASKDAADTAKDVGKHWGEQSEAGRKLGDAIDDMADSAFKQAQQMDEAGESTGMYLQGVRDSLIKTAEQMGASKKEAEAYVDQLGLTPERIETVIDADTDKALAKWDEVYDRIWPNGGHPPMVVDVNANTDPADQSVERFKGAVVDGPPANAKVGADTSPGEGKVGSFQETIEASHSDVNVGADTSLAKDDLYAQLKEIDRSGGTISIDGDPVTAEQALFRIMSKTDGSTGTIKIDGNNDPAKRELSGTVRIVNNADGTITIKGNNRPANSATDGAVSHANRSHGTIKVGADASSANSAINNAARTRWSTIRVRFQATNSPPTVRPGVRAATFAVGGAVRGPGTGTSDSIPSLLSNGEHVFTAREVAMAGGQDAIYRMREAIRAGALRFADGGAVGDKASSRAQAALWAQPAQARSVTTSTAQVDSSQIAAAVRAGMEDATVIAQVSDRVAASLHQRGRATSRALGGVR